MTLMLDLESVYAHGIMHVHDFKKEHRDTGDKYDCHFRAYYDLKFIKLTHTKDLNYSLNYGDIDCLFYLLFWAVKTGVHFIHLLCFALLAEYNVYYTPPQQFVGGI